METSLSHCPPNAQIVKNEKNIKIIGKYWSCFVQWTNPLLMTHKF